MKKIQISLTLLLFSCSSLFSQINMDCYGRVGLGTTVNSSYKITMFSPIYIRQSTYPGIIITGGGPNYGINIYPTYSGAGRLGRSDKPFGEIYYVSLNKVSSDSSLKENIRDINNSLDIILNIRGIRFDFKKYVFEPGPYADNELINNKIEEKRKNNIGFIAQEMINVLPEAVSYDDSTNLYSIDYTTVVPVIVQAMKEQQIIIENLQSEIIELRNLIESNDNLKSAPTTTSIDESSLINENTLYQNNPNPFNENTQILYHISNYTNKALLKIYNTSGQQLKSIPLNNKGYGSVTINGGEFDAGVYIYALIIDEQEIDTKKMILTE